MLEHYTYFHPYFPHAEDMLRVFRGLYDSIRMKLLQT